MSRLTDSLDRETARHHWMCTACDLHIEPGDTMLTDWDNDEDHPPKLYHEACAAHEDGDHEGEGYDSRCECCRAEAPPCECGGPPQCPCNIEEPRAIVSSPSCRTPGDPSREVAERAPGRSSSSIDTPSSRGEGIATTAAPLHHAGEMALEMVAEMRRVSR